MSGLAGLISAAPEADCQRTVERMVACIQGRHARAVRMESDAAIGIYAGWLTTRDSWPPVQSRFDQERQATIVLCGEARLDSVEGGARPTGHERADLRHDPLAAYQADGGKFARRLNGLFSALIIDRLQGVAFLMNDRYGSERLYLIETAAGVHFSSDVRSILAVVPEARCFDEQAVAEYLTYGSTRDGRTLFRGVRLLDGAGIWTIARGAVRGRAQYFEPAEWEHQSELTTAAFQARFEETLDRIVPRYLEGAGPIGISITGGLDTRMIMACLPKSDRQAVCYTFAGMRGETSDVTIGRDVARMCGLRHQTLRIDAGFLSNFGDHVDQTVLLSGGVAGALGAHEIHFSRLARELSPVRLTGNFGSEVLRNMSTLKSVAPDRELVDPGFLPTLAAAAVPKPAAHAVTQAAFREIPWHLSGTVAVARSELVFRTPYLDNDLVALAYRAPAAVRQSPDSALALVHALNSAMSEIPTDRGIAWGDSGLRSAARQLGSRISFKLDYWDKEGLPSGLSPLDPVLNCLDRMGVMGQHKFLPYRRWFRKELATLVQDVAASSTNRDVGCWNTAVLADRVRRHVTGTGNYLREIHAMLSLDSVQRLLIRGAEALPARRLNIEVSPK